LQDGKHHSTNRGIFSEWDFRYNRLGANWGNIAQWICQNKDLSTIIAGLEQDLL